MATIENELMHKDASIIYDKFNYLMNLYKRYPIETLQTTIDMINVSLETKADAGNIEKLQKDYNFVLSNLAKKLKITEENLQILAIDNLRQLTQLVNGTFDKEMRCYYVRLLEQYRSLLNKLKFDGSPDEAAQIQYLLHMDEAKIQEIIKNHRDSEFFKRYQESMQMQLQKKQEIQQDFQNKQPNYRVSYWFLKSALFALLAVAFFSSVFVAIFFVSPLISSAFAAVIAVLGCFGFGAIVGGFCLEISVKMEQPTPEWTNWNTEFDAAKIAIENEISNTNDINSIEFDNELQDLYIQETNQSLEFDEVLHEDNPQCDAVAKTLKNKSVEVVSYAERRFAFFQEKHPQEYDFEEVKKNIPPTGI